MISPTTSIIVNPDFVEYRTPSTGGILIVRVYPPTRLSSIVDLYGHRYPAILGIDELLAYVNDATKRFASRSDPAVGISSPVPSTKLFTATDVRNLLSKE